MTKLYLLNAELTVALTLTLSAVTLNLSLTMAALWDGGLTPRIKRLKSEGTL